MRGINRLGILAMAVVLALWLALSVISPALAQGQPEDGTAMETEETGTEAEIPEETAAEDTGTEAEIPEETAAEETGTEAEIPEENGTTVESTTGAEIPGEEAVSLPVTEPTAGAALSSFDAINVAGFGSTDNKYSWSMVNFKGKIYVGTWNLGTTFGLLQLLLGFFIPGYLTSLSNGTEVWRYDEEISGTTWTRVVNGGLGDTDNMGLRKMMVWDDPDDSPDRGAAIYGTTINYEDGLEVWRTFDGINWEIVVGRGAPIGNGFGHGEANGSGRGMVAMEEYLYISTMRADGGQIWRTANGTDWEYVTSVAELESGDFFNWFHSFGSRAMADMCLFDDDGDGVEELFVGTWRLFGFSVYRYDPSLGTWSRVAESGIGKWTNSGVHQLIPFNGRLWILTVNFFEAFDVYASNPADPSAGITSNADWELVATNGFTDRGNAYAWNGIVYPVGENAEELPESRLFIGTFNLSRGFYVYSVTKSGEWAVEVGTGSGVQNGITTIQNYGVRTFAIYEGKIVIGSAGMQKGTDVFLAW